MLSPVFNRSSVDADRDMVDDRVVKADTEATRVATAAMERKLFIVLFGVG